MKAYNDSNIITKIYDTIVLLSCLPEAFTAKEFKNERDKANSCVLPYTLETLQKIGVVIVVSGSTIHTVKTVPIYEVQDAYTKEVLFEGTEKACENFSRIRMKYLGTGWVDYDRHYKYSKQESYVEQRNIRYSVDYNALNTYLKENFSVKILEQIQKRLDESLLYDIIVLENERK